jgi:hypothetical protein
MKKTSADGIFSTRRHSGEPGERHEKSEEFFLAIAPRLQAAFREKLHYPAGVITISGKSALENKSGPPVFLNPLQALRPYSLIFEGTQFHELLYFPESGHAGLHRHDDFGQYHSPGRFAGLFL